MNDEKKTTATENEQGPQPTEEEQQEFKRRYEICSKMLAQEVDRFMKRMAKAINKNLDNMVGAGTFFMELGSCLAFNYYANVFAGNRQMGTQDMNAVREEATSLIRALAHGVLAVCDGFGVDIVEFVGSVKEGLDKGGNRTHYANLLKEGLEKQGLD